MKTRCGPGLPHDDAEADRCAGRSCDAGLRDGNGLSRHRQAPRPRRGTGVCRNTVVDRAVSCPARAAGNRDPRSRSGGRPRASASARHRDARGTTGGNEAATRWTHDEGARAALRQRERRATHREGRGTGCRPGVRRDAVIHRTVPAAAGATRDRQPAARAGRGPRTATASGDADASRRCRRTDAS